MQEKMVNDQDKIERVYDKPGPSAFLGAEKLHITLRQKKTGNNKPSVYKIRKWLQNQDDYSLQNQLDEDLNEHGFSFRSK